MERPLGLYVRAAHRLGGIELVSQQDTPSDALSDGLLDETFYYFADGTILRYRMEQDEGNFDPDPDAATCLPCEISYQILQHPAQDKIVPKRKRFTDQCRHLFWLKMQKPTE